MVGIATGYRPDSPEIESRWGARFSALVQTGPGAHPASCTMSTRSFPGVKSSRGVTLTPHPLVVPQSRKGTANTSTAPMGRMACTEPQCLYKGNLYLTCIITVVLYIIHISLFFETACFTTSADTNTNTHSVNKTGDFIQKQTTGSGLTDWLMPQGRTHMDKLTVAHSTHLPYCMLTTACRRTQSSAPFTTVPTLHPVST